MENPLQTEQIYFSLTVRHGPVPVISKKTFLIFLMPFMISFYY